MNDGSKFMIGTVQGEHSMQLNIRGSRGRNATFHLCRSENCFGIFGSFENFFVHACVARTVPAVAAGSEDDDFSTRFSRLWIEMYRSVFYGEGAMDHVQRAVYIPM